MFGLRLIGTTFVSVERFLEPLSYSVGSSAPTSKVRVSYFLSGGMTITPGIEKKSIRPGDVTTNQCSPKERSTLLRMPNIQKYLSRPSDTVHREGTLPDGTHTVKQKWEVAGDSLALLIEQTESKTVSKFFSLNQ